MKQCCLLPIVPPSVNNLFFNAGKRRVKTGAYSAWAAEAVIRMSIGLKPVAIYPCVVLIEVYGGKEFNEQRDIANCEKAATDALVTAGVLQGDSVKFVRLNAQLYVPRAKSEHSYCNVWIFDTYGDLARYLLRVEEAEASAVAA